jgi:hypothetical protein
MKMVTRNGPNLSLENINVEYTPKKTDLNVKLQRHQQKTHSTYIPA